MPEAIDSATRLAALVTAIPVLPFAASVAIGLWMFLVRAPSERVASRLVIASLLGSLACLVGAAVLTAGAPSHRVELGSWFEIDAYEFETGFVVDRLSLVFTATQLVVALLVARFAVRYMHNERGFARFFALIAFAAAGLTCIVLAHSYDLLFAGWEMVGLASVLLVAFFHERKAPVTAALVLLTTYRALDIGILMGCVLLHSVFGNTLYAEVLASDAPELSGGMATIVGLLFLASAMGKSAQFPFGGWLPRAMEGPTPSSALFYGALSVHAGVYLLLRSAPLIERSIPLSVAIVVVGVLTAIHGAVVGRVQPDVKGQLAYATMTQLGVMLVEIGLGLYDLALFHVVAHAMLRTYQLLRAPNALADAHRIRAALGTAEAPLSSRFSPAMERWLYGFALHRFHADTILQRFVAQPVLRLADALARREERFVDRFAVRTERAASRAAERAVLSTDGGEP